jgi:hypothetical protein
MKTGADDDEIRVAEAIEMTYDATASGSSMSQALGSAAAWLFSMPCFTTKLTCKHLRPPPQPFTFIRSRARF